ncbi:YkvA family protein [Clostridium perfringens]
MSEENKELIIEEVEIKGKKRKINLEKYAKFFSDKDFFEKLRKFAKKAGIKVVYTCLLLYYTLKKDTTPKWAKSIIISALGYFIFPIDFLPDIAPIVGYTDDLGLLIPALGAVAFYIDDEVKEQAKKKLKDWFGEYEEDSLEDINEKISRG